MDPRFVCPVCYRTGFVRRNEVTWTGGIRVRGDLVDTLASMPGHRAATKFEVTKDVPQTFQEEVSSTSTSKPPAVREVAPSETPSRDPSTANKAVAPPRSSSGRGGAPAKKTKDDSDEE